MYKHVARLFNNLPIHQKLLLISTIPLASLILVSIVTYINVQTFSQDEERLNNLYLTQKTAAQYMRLVVDIGEWFSRICVDRRCSRSQAVSGGT